MKKIIFVFFVFSQFAVSAKDSAEFIIDELIGKFRSVNSYIADAVIRPDISFLKILPHKATVYFRQPDQFRMKTEGISILPKQNIDNVFTLLINKESYDAVADDSDSANVAILTIIPAADTADLMLARLWVDTVNDIILKARLTTRSNGTIFIEYKYDRFIAYGLPDQVIFTIDVKKFKVPKAIAADINTSSKPSDTDKKQKPGLIYVNLTNYRINAAIPATIFK